MRTLPQFLEAYGESHRNPVNQWVHFICVPLIFFSSVGLLWLLQVGAWLGMAEPAATWVNGATIIGVLAAIFYLMLGVGTLVLMAGWFALSVWLVLLLEASALSMGWTCAGIWVASWAAQFWGHKIEGKKPSFSEDLIFLLIGPVFVCVELAAKAGLPVKLPTTGAQH